MATIPRGCRLVKLAKTPPGSILATGIAEPAVPEAREFGILVSDLRGFTPMMEQYPPLAVVALLNHYFRSMIAIVDRHGGTIDKFMGDAIMALFDSREREGAPRRMLDCAIAMQLAMDEVNSYAQQQGLPGIYMGIGLNYGTVIACELGSEIYREFTVLGDQVNLASRLATYCLRGQVLCSENFYRLLRDDVVLGHVNEMHFKGKSQPLTVYEVLGSTGATEARLPVRDSRRSQRVGADLPITYLAIEHKAVSGLPVQAQLVDVSLYGMRMLSTRQQQYLDEIRIAMPFLASESREVYGKVLRCRAAGAGRFLINVEFTYVDEGAGRAIRVFVDSRL
jgi:adenylate cyclase